MEHNKYRFGHNNYYQDYYDDEYYDDTDYVFRKNEYDMVRPNHNSLASKHKTVLWKFYQKGYWKFGHMWFKAHGHNELRYPDDPVSIEVIKMYEEMQRIPNNKAKNKSQDIQSYYQGNQIEFLWYFIFINFQKMCKFICSNYLYLDAYEK